MVYKVGTKNPNQKARHVIIRGLGDRYGDTVEDLTALLAPFGAVESMELPSGKSHLFATMDSVISAERVVDGLKLSAGSTGREICVNFCDLRGDEFAGLLDVPSTMSTDDNESVPGLSMIYEYVDEAQEERLIDVLSSESYNWTQLSLRRVVHFGYAFDYASSDVDIHSQTDPIPAEYAEMAQQIHDQGHVPFVADQLTVNEYKRGGGIPPHIDTHSSFMDGIAVLSLKSGSVMSFIDPASGRKSDIYLPRRSLLILSGESRYRFRHTIRARQLDRIDGRIIPRDTRLSLTFRKVNVSKRCECAYPESCDRDPVSNDTALRPDCDSTSLHQSPQVEIDFVHSFYDKIADHFSSTRYKPWPLVELFIKSLPAYSVVADVGCGNGKYLSCVNPFTQIIGFDRCASLISHCRSRLPGSELGICDALHIPLRDNSVDAALSIAVLHHISNVARRLLLLSELVRIVRPDGLILIVAWALEQDSSSRRKFTEKDCFVPWHMTPRFVKDDSGSVVQRFCHVYAQGEIRSLLEQIPGIEVLSERYDQSNWLIVVKKLRSLYLPCSLCRSGQQSSSV